MSLHETVVTSLEAMDLEALTRSKMLRIAAAQSLVETTHRAGHDRMVLRIFN